MVSTILFFLGTIHVGTSLQQLLDAFVYTPTNVSDYSTTYWLDYTTTLHVLKDSIYDTLVRNNSISTLYCAQGREADICTIFYSSKFDTYSRTA